MTRIMICVSICIVAGMLWPTTLLGYSYEGYRYDYGDGSSTVVYSVTRTCIRETVIADPMDSSDRVERFSGPESDLSDSDLSSPYAGSDIDGDYESQPVPQEEAYPVEEVPSYAYDQEYPSTYVYDYPSYYSNLGYYGYYPYFPRFWGGGFWYGHRPFYHGGYYHRPFAYGNHFVRGWGRPGFHGWGGNWGRGRVYGARYGGPHIAGRSFHGGFAPRSGFGHSRGGMRGGGMRHR